MLLIGTYHYSVVRTRYSNYSVLCVLFPGLGFGCPKSTTQLTRCGIDDELPLHVRSSHPNPPFFWLISIVLLWNPKVEDHHTGSERWYKPLVDRKAWGKVGSKHLRVLSKRLWSLSVSGLMTKLLSGWKHKPTRSLRLGHLSCS